MKPARHGRLLRAAATLIPVTLACWVAAVPAKAAAYRYWGYLTKGAWPASSDTAITIADPKAATPASLATPPAVGHSNNDSRGLLLGWALAVALVAALGFAAWRRGSDTTDNGASPPSP